MNSSWEVVNDLTVKNSGSLNIISSTSLLSLLISYHRLVAANRFQQEQAALRPLPRLPLAPCREFRVNVSRFSTIQVLGKRYSVPARLIGTTVLACLRAATVEVYLGTHQVLTLPRLQGAAMHAIN
jgi:hypothetical protein